MNLEELKKHVRAVKSFEWLGQTIYLRKLSARDYVELFGRLKEEKAKDPEADRQATLKYHVTMAARTVADKDGNLLFDSDEGRQALEECGFTDLCQLGEMVLNHSGLEDQKKSEAKTTYSASDSPH